MSKEQNKPVFSLDLQHIKDPYPDGTPNKNEVFEKNA